MGPSLRRPRGRILASLLLLLFGVGVAPLLVTSFLLTARSRENLEFAQKSSQLDKARSLSEQVSAFVFGLQAQMEAIARTLELDADASAGDFAARVERIRATRALNRYVDDVSPLTYISVVAASGSGVRYGTQLPDPMVEQLLEDGFRRGMSGEPLMSHPVVSDALKEPVMVLAQPVRGPAGAARGVVIAVAGLSPLWRMTREVAEGGRMEVYIVDARGRVVAHSDPAQVKDGLDLSRVEIVRKFLGSKGRASSTEPFVAADATGREVRMLGTFTRVTQNGWGVIVQVDEASAFYTALRMRNESLALAAIVAVLALLLGTVFAGAISRPIHALAQGAQRLAGGAYDTRVRVRARNEVGLLADAFNHMGEEIQKAIEEVRRQAAANKELFLGSIRMLANAIDEKDPYTRGHSERVAFYSAMVAKHLGMPADEVERVHLSGLIHDVGKIGIEDKILRKAAALTDDEYEIMKQHPRKGEHILDAVPTLKQMAGAGLMHHENVDGSGYPDGLKGEQIPLLGRIVSVADAFDAMTTDRPYSKAMTFEAAVARLKFLAGKKFDATCVEAFEKAYLAGEVSPAKARLASVASRQVKPPETQAAAVAR